MKIRQERSKEETNDSQGTLCKSVCTKGIEKQIVWSKYKNKTPSPTKNTTPTLPQNPYVFSVIKTRY